MIVKLFCISQVWINLMKCTLTPRAWVLAPWGTTSTCAGSWGYSVRTTIAWGVWQSVRQWSATPAGATCWGKPTTKSSSRFITNSWPPRKFNTKTAAFSLMYLDLKYNIIYYLIERGLLRQYNFLCSEIFKWTKFTFI